jgi:hypothetical protein
MTREEQKSVDRVYELLSDIKKSNELYRELVTNKVNELEGVVQKKHVPLQMEDEIMKAVDASLTKALHEALTGYNSPLTKYAHNVVTKYQSQIEALFDNVVKEGIQTEEFKNRVREVLLNKIAKTMISGVDGSIDKTINLMKQDQVFRSRLTLCVNNLVDEFLSKKQ